MRPTFPWIILSALVLLLALAPAAPVLAQTGNPPVQAEIAEPAFALPWYIGVLFFVLVAVGVTVYKNRLAKNRKKPKPTANT